MLCGDDEDNFKSGSRRKEDSDWISGSSLIIHAKQGIARSHDFLPLRRSISCGVISYYQARGIADQNLQQNEYQQREGGRENWSGLLV